jgi:hypothetical protein
MDLILITNFSLRIENFELKEIKKKLKIKSLY